MTVKSLNLIVNDYCNHKCDSCGIWKNKSRVNMPAQYVEKLMRLFPEVEDISLTGGEPFMHPNLPDLISPIVEARNLKMLFINTNGSMPKRVKEVLDTFSFNDTYLCVSLEGPPELHNKLRGVKSYSTTLETLNINGNHKKIISTTLQRDNCTTENMSFLVQLAKTYDAEVTFRFAEIGEYYGNESSPPNFPNQQQKLEVMDFMSQYRKDSFFELYDKFVRTQEVSLMRSEDKVLCRAGEVFLTVQPNGSFSPCIFSSRTIGGINGVLENVDDLGKYEPCPCFTECTIYPMLNYGGRK